MVYAIVHRFRICSCNFQKLMQGSQISYGLCTVPTHIQQSHPEEQPSTLLERAVHLTLFSRV